MRALLAVVVALSAAAVADDLSPEAFDRELVNQHGLLIDVRTAGEVAQGALPGASVIDFNGEKFEQKISLLARDKPVFVYCASGNRSGKAATLMKQLGFSKVFNLAGGFRGWKAAGLPVEVPKYSGGDPAGVGVEPAAFDQAVQKAQRLLVVFHTPWCAPCREMAPVVGALEKATKGLAVLRVDLDASEALALREKVQGVPVFVFYAGGKERNRLLGVQSQAALENLVK